MAQTPLMTQYLEIKQRFPDALLFFRMGDFYELFFDDARLASSILEIALTTRNKTDPDPIPMCGVPHHAAASYINRIVASGRKVAVCEQLEDPALAKGIVKRDVVRVVTPGTQFDPEALEAANLNLTHAALPQQTNAGTLVSWASCDFSTGYFCFGQSSYDHWYSYLQTNNVTEIILPESTAGHEARDNLQHEHIGTYCQTVNAFYFDQTYARQRILEQFETTSLGSVHSKLEENSTLWPSIGALIRHFQETQPPQASGPRRIPMAHRLHYWSEDKVMELDPATVAALELLPQSRPRSGFVADVNLFNLINKTKTAMGARLLRQWMLRPLTDAKLVNQRLDEVASFHQSPSKKTASSLPDLSEIYDLERLLARISTQGANARDLRNLADSIARSQQLSEALAQSKGPQSLLKPLCAALSKNLLDLAHQAQEALSETPPATIRDGGLFRRGFHSGLDELIDLSENGTQWLAEYEAKERQSTGVSSLKVRFNRVFGYYIEITKSNIGSAPAHYVRKQTTANGERYITEELKKFEDKILNAEKRRQDLEISLFQEFCQKFVTMGTSISKLAHAVAHIDACASLAFVALERNYVRPQVDQSIALDITMGRHPTVELMGGFVANSITLTHEQRLMLITGPNMGGKSTVMRQTALIVLLAQMGSYVPATQAHIGICDRIFTRIGANDNIARGHSTFMVEMSEMSYILRNATERSLVVLDEVGRGTSTYDGLSLAWALAEELLNGARTRTLFATHYHELTELASRHPAAFNMRVGVEWSEADDVRFLYRLEEGPAERSYGIYVAKLAGLPSTVLQRAHHLLEKLEGANSKTACEESKYEPMAPSAYNKKHSTMPLNTPVKKTNNQMGFTF